MDAHDFLANSWHANLDVVDMVPHPGDKGFVLDSRHFQMGPWEITQNSPSTI